MNALDFIYSVVALLSAPIWGRKSRQGWDERLARSLPALPSPDPARPRILLHAVSVGEVNALRELVSDLSADSDVVVSVTTDTGIKRAHALFDDTDHVRVVRAPLDFSGSVRRFLDAVEPGVVGLVELEIWPNFVAACNARSVPVAVINGRLSERSFRGYRVLRPLLRATFARLALACTQDEPYAERFRHMGVDPSRVRVTGNMKWDIAGPVSDRSRGEEIARQMGIDPERPLIIGGSTAEGEEALLHKACPDGVQLLCAPRRPERFGQASTGLPGCVHRSDPDLGDAASGRFLLDSVGELSAMYALADVVVLGRSFYAGYGSDPMEPAAMAKPVLIGPNVADFRDAVAALQAASGLQVVEPGELAPVLSALMAEPDARRQMGAAAAACVESRRGASAAHAEALRTLARTSKHAK